MFYTRLSQPRSVIPRSSLLQISQRTVNHHPGKKEPLPPDCDYNHSTTTPQASSSGFPVTLVNVAPKKEGAPFITSTFFHQQTSITLQPKTHLSDFFLSHPSFDHETGQMRPTHFPEAQEQKETKKPYLAPSPFVKNYRKLSEARQGFLQRVQQPRFRQTLFSDMPLRVSHREGRTPQASTPALRVEKVGLPIREEMRFRIHAMVSPPELPAQGSPKFPACILATVRPLIGAGPYRMIAENDLDFLAKRRVKRAFLHHEASSFELNLHRFELVAKLNSEKPEEESEKASPKEKDRNPITSLQSLSPRKPTEATIKLWCCVVVLPLAKESYGLRVAQGVAECEKTAENLCYMHAELILGVLGFPLYTISSVQEKYALARRKEGYICLLPSEVRGSQNLSQESMPLPLFAKNVKAPTLFPFRVVQEAPDSALARENTEQTQNLRLPLRDALLPEPKPSFKTPTRFGLHLKNLLTSTPLLFDQSLEQEGNPFHLVYLPREEELATSPYYNPPYIMDYTSRIRVTKYLRSLGLSLEKEIKQSTLVHRSKQIWICEIALPGIQGPKGPLCGIGIASKTRDAETAMCLHIEYLLDYLNLPLFQENSLQYTRRRYAKFFGRQAPKLGDNPKIRYDLPPPFRFSKNQNPHPIFLHDQCPHLAAGTHCHVSALDPSAPGTLGTYLKHIGQSYILDTKSFSFRYPTRYPSDIPHHTTIMFSRFLYRHLVELPLPGGLSSRYAIGSSSSEADARLLSIMHACALLKAYGISKLTQWMPLPHLKTLQEIQLPPPYCRTPKWLNQTTMLELSQTNPQPARSLLKGSRPRKKNTSSPLDSPFTEQGNPQAQRALQEKEESSYLVSKKKDTLNPNPSKKRTIPDRTTADGSIFVQIDPKEKNRAIHSLYRPDCLAPQSKRRVRAWCARREGKIPCIQVHFCTLLRKRGRKEMQDSVWGLVRCRLRLPLMRTAPHWVEPLFATGEAMSRINAEICAYMHMELLLDALGIALYEEEELQQLHSRYVRQRGRWAVCSPTEEKLPLIIPKGLPPPLRLVHPGLSKARMMPELTREDIPDFTAAETRVIPHMIGRVHELLAGRSATLASLLARHPGQGEEIRAVYALGTYLRRFFPGFNHHSLLSVPVASVTRSCAVAYGWVPLPDRRYHPVFGLANARDTQFSLLLNAAELIHSTGYLLRAELPENEPSASRFSPSSKSSQGPIFVQTLRSYRLIRLVTPQCVYSLPRSMNSGEFFSTLTSHPGASSLSLGREPESFTRLPLLGPRDWGEDPDTLSDIRVLPVLSPSIKQLLATKSSHEAEPLALLTHFSAWKTYVSTCVLYISIARHNLNLRRLAQHRPPYCGDPLVDDAMDNLHPSLVEIHARTNLYNFCVRKGLDYPSMELQKWRSIFLVTFVVPGYPEILASGCAAQILTATRRAAMHGLEILRRIDPEFQPSTTHQEFDARGFGTEPAFTARWMRELMELYLLCLALPPLTLRSRAQMTEPGRSSICCEGFINHPSPEDACERLGAQARDRTVRGAQDEVITQLFLALRDKSPSFQSLLRFMRAYPQLQPAPVPRLSLPVVWNEMILALPLPNTSTEVLEEEEEEGEGEERGEEEGEGGSPKTDVSLETTTKTEEAPGQSRRTTPSAPIQTLPIVTLAEELLQGLRKNSVVLICGPTGSGKTTQVPQFILRANPQASILVTQPRRISAISLAHRLAVELGETHVGRSVGYTVRFASCKGARLNFATPGMVLRLLRRNPQLEGFTHVILDEVHERDLPTEILLILMRRLVLQRPELRLLLMSATLQAQSLVDYFANRERPQIPVFEIDRGSYPVKMHFLDDLAESAKREKFSSVSLIQHDKGILQKAEMALDYPLLLWVLKRILVQDDDRGFAVLVFLPGLAEIQATAQLACTLQVYDPVLLHSHVRPEEQMKCFEPVAADRVKLILSTNLAESAVTIPQVRVVVDLGRAKTRGPVSVASKGAPGTRLWPMLVAQANLLQRTGRAGRTQGGICYRLFSRRDFAQRPVYSDPEILRTPLESILLQILALETVSSARLLLQEALAPPPRVQVDEAFALLHRFKCH